MQIKPQTRELCRSGIQTMRAKKKKLKNQKKSIKKQILNSKKNLIKYTKVTSHHHQDEICKKKKFCFEFI